MDYRKELTEKILPFWLENAIDENNGGIFTCLDRQGGIYGREKSVWFQGRALWTFSKAYNVIEKRAEYLAAAKKIYEFLKKCTDTDGRMFFTVTEDGRGIQKRRYYFSETFAAIGCAELYRATGDKKVLSDAEKYFETAYECFVGKRKTEPKFRNKNEKSLSPIMIMLATAQVMRSAVSEKCGYYNSIAKSCLEEILNGGFLKENALLESVAQNGEFIKSPSGRVVNPGHSLEAAWFIMAESIMTGNKQAAEAAKHIIDITVPLGMDKNHGGIIAFADAYGKPPIQLEWDMKLWWPQCEAMIAARLAYLIFNEEKYKSLYEELQQYCQKYFVDKEYGEWYGYLHYDNTPSTDLKGNIFKGPFHIPRLYMIMTLMEESGGIVKFME